MKEIQNLKKQNITLSDDEFEKAAAGTDTDSLITSGKTIPLPEARNKKMLMADMPETLSRIRRRHSIMTCQIE